MVDRHPRRRNRLRHPGHDYAGPGAVFVTICTEGRQPLFGAIDDGRMDLSPVGAMAAATWERIPDRFPVMGIDAIVVMPDHVHGILFPGANPDHEDAPVPVGDVVRWFKNATIRAYKDGVTRDGWEPYDLQLWQDKFHDEIIRSERHLETVRAYIAGNPGRWWERHVAESREPTWPLTPPT